MWSDSADLRYTQYRDRQHAAQDRRSEQIAEKLVAEAHPYRRCGEQFRVPAAHAAESEETERHCQHQAAGSEMPG